MAFPRYFGQCPKQAPPLSTDLTSSKHGLPFIFLYVIVSSAGVGRTGTFITIDYMLKQMEAEGIIDIFNFVRHMRYRRNYMVQTTVRTTNIGLYTMLSIGSTVLKLNRVYIS